MIKFIKKQRLLFMIFVILGLFNFNFRAQAFDIEGLDPLFIECYKDAISIFMNGAGAELEKNYGMCMMEMNIPKKFNLDTLFSRSSFFDEVKATVSQYPDKLPSEEDLEYVKLIRALVIDNIGIHEKGNLEEYIFKLLQNKQFGQLITDRALKVYKKYHRIRYFAYNEERETIERNNQSEIPSASNNISSRKQNKESITNKNETNKKTPSAVNKKAVESTNKYPPLHSSSILDMKNKKIFLVCGKNVESLNTIQFDPRVMIRHEIDIQRQLYDNMPISKWTNTELCIEFSDAEQKVMNCMSMGDSIINGVYTSKDLDDGRIQFTKNIVGKCIILNPIM